MSVISRDTYSPTITSSANGATSVSFSYTASGTNRYVIVYSYDEAGNTTSGVNYGSTAMTLLDHVSRNPNVGTLEIYAWGLANPPSTAQTVTITRAGTSTKVGGYAISYKDAQQETTPDSTATGNGSGSSSTTVSATITTTRPNTAISGFSVMDNGGISGGTNLTLLSGSGGGYGLFEASTFPLTSAGSYTGTSIGTSGDIGILLIALSGVGATVTTSAVSDIDFYTATGNGEVVSDGGAIISERGICWSTSSSPTTSSTKIVVSGTTGAFTGAITGLPYNTHYYVRAYATNANGTFYGANVEFTTLAPPANQISKDISGVEGATYDVSVTVTGTVGSVTVKLGSTGSTQTITAGSGVTTFSGTYGGVTGLIITRTSNFNGTVDDVMYVLRLGSGTINWALNIFTIVFPITSSVLFKRIEDKDFNKFRIYRYLDILFKNLDGYITATIRQEQSDVVTDKTKVFVVGNVVGDTESPFIKKRISFLSKNQAVLIGLSNANLNEAFTISQFALTGYEQPKKQFSPSKIISIT